MTESLAGPHSARGSSYSYTYESHYDNPPEDEEVIVTEDAEHHTQQTHKVSDIFIFLELSDRIILDYSSHESNNNAKCSTDPCNIALRRSLL